MLVLKEQEICPYASQCPYNTDVNPCFGARTNRPNKFFCEFVINGKIKEGGTRLPQDKTGRMKVLME